MNLRPRKRKPFSGFTNAEIEKMEQLRNEYKNRTLEVDFFKKLVTKFNRSCNRAGKPRLKWTEIQSWFRENQQSCPLTEPSFDAAEKKPVVSEVLDLKKNTKNPKMVEDESDQDMLQTLEFEARSSQDGAWYDVEAFLSHRFLSSGEIEVYVRYAGFGSDEDEWVNVKNNVRKRSVALEHWECQKVTVGEQLLCFQESKDRARYYDAHVIDIQRKWHDIRGCRCLFLVKYDHNNTQERVQLKRLCCRPEMLQ